MRLPTLSETLAVTFYFARLVESKAVFAHYMVGTITEDHAHTDIDDALAMGFDAFALNIGDPTQSYATDALSYMFDYAASKSFHLFFSMDLSAAGGAGKGPNDYIPLLNQYKGHSAYYTGPNGYPFVSTFSVGSFSNDQWTTWKASVGNMYFVPDFDGTAGYYTADPGWWAYWGDVVDGVFSWESAWPVIGATDAGDISQDQTVIGGTSSHGKTYMMPLSSLQYKDAYSTNLYRQGELTFPIRMANILGMSTQPDFVEVITWNDGPESHYIGNLFPESNTDAFPALYATQAAWPHIAWQPLVTSFMNAYRNTASASSMAPPSGVTAIGSLWYKTILQSATCTAPSGSSSSDSMYYEQPQGFSTGQDNLNWAVVLASGASGYKIRTISDGAVLQTIGVNPGLNYGASSGVQAGAQSLELVDSSGNVVMTASGAQDVSSGCPENIYNMNYQVAGLA